MLAPLTLVRQIPVQPTVVDVPATVRRRWLESPTSKRIRPGQRIAIGCGSRGINGIADIMRATIDVVREIGAKPFVVAAMGSHGGATPEGQRELLASYGVSEENLGVEVRTEMTSRQIGINSWGEPVWWDANALDADGVLLVARIKPHTDFRGKLESGVCKMAVIGLGKREGAMQHHRWGWKGLQQMLPETMKTILEKTKFLGGLGILENAREETAILEVLDRDVVMDREPVLLERAKGLIGKIPFAELDILIVGEIGKNYSGAGIDPNVVGRLLIEAAPELETNKPRVTRMACLDVSPESHGNATGVGIADLCTNRLLRAIDPVPFRMNNLTACFLWRSKLPFAFETDREVVQSCLDTCWQPIPEKLKLAIVPNTLEVAEMWISPALLDEARSLPEMEVTDRTMELPFDADGNVIQEAMFPHSVRGRRAAHR